ncbi:MAG: rRNA maturation RNase YbeY [Flavobacteriales bacterium]|jgi:probable rRNA maturation factor|nr:rRNA maturation RNase YbeY [Flavobacteriales bacterium]
MIEYQYIECDEIITSEEISLWLSNVIKEEGKEIGELVYVLCKDEYLLEKNIQFLNHDTLTDVITFDYCENDLINGDILISTDRVEENAKTYKVNYLTELHRVMVHGLLHLLGYKDKKEKDAKTMREKENYYLNKIIN